MHLDTIYLATSPGDNEEVGKIVGALGFHPIAEGFYKARAPEDVGFFGPTDRDRALESQLSELLAGHEFTVALAEFDDLQNLL